MSINDMVLMAIGISYIPMAVFVGVIMYSFLMTKEPHHPDNNRITATVVGLHWPILIMVPPAFVISILIGLIFCPFIALAELIGEGLANGRR